LGEGHYSQGDVKESARAFTGRRFDHDYYPYSMYVDETARDTGLKTILGETGDFRGEDVIDIILRQEQTARHIAHSVIRFFCSDHPSQVMVEDCSMVYRKSNYNMKALLTAVFNHPEFDDSPPKIKSPVELLVGFQRKTGFRTSGMKTNKFFLRYCGHELFNPPSVAGWSGGEDWLRGEKTLIRLFLTTALVRISNRRFPRSATSYKVMSRLVHPEVKSFRFIADARWDNRQFREILANSNISFSTWMLGMESGIEELEQAITAPGYQYM